MQLNDSLVDGYTQDWYGVPPTAIFVSTEAAAGMQVRQQHVKKRLSCSNTVLTPLTQFEHL